MKQKLPYIIMFITTLAWSNGAWGVDGYRSVLDLNETKPMPYKDWGGSYEPNYTYSFIANDFVTFNLFANNLHKAAGGFRGRGSLSSTLKSFNGSLSWIVTSYYYINISSLSATAYSTAGYPTFSINGVSYSIPHIDRDYTVTSSNLSLGNNASVSVTTGSGANLINNISATYSISHYELDLSSLSSEIDKAQTKYNGLSNKTTDHAKALSSAINAANAFYSSDDCKFPNSYYFNGNEGTKKPSDVDAEVLKLQKAKAIYDFEEAKYVATNKGYTNTNIRTVTYNSIQTYLTTTYTTTGSATVQTINNATTALIDLISTADAERTAISSFNTAKTNAGAFAESSVPNAVYTKLHSKDSHNPLTASVDSTNDATTTLNSAISAAEATTSPYQTALGYYTTAFNTNHDDHSDNELIAAELSTAKADLEASTTTELIAAAQNKFIAIKEKLDAVSAFQTAKTTATTYEQTKVPDAVYTLLHQYDENFNPYEKTKTQITDATTNLNNALTAAEETTTTYQSALGHYNTAVGLNNSNIPSGVATSEINIAKNTLEECTTVSGVSVANTLLLGIIAKFDEIDFDLDLSANIPWEGSVTETWATAASKKAVTYTSSNTAVVSILGSTFKRVAAGEVTITASTIGTTDKYETRATRTFKVIPRYYFSAAAYVGNVAGGTVKTATVTDSYKDGIAGSTATEHLTTQASFQATASEDYTFMGWSATPDGDVISGSSGVPGSEESLELYAIFKLSRIHLYSNTKPSYEAGEYDEVQLHRTFNKGYSTIALPFQTTLYELTGQRSAEDWVAQLSVVTYTAADKNEEDKGYTLYFKKTGHGADADGGIIEANKPYVLHLSKVVENPVWTNLQVKSPSSSSVVQADKGYADNGYGDYSDWRMHANYEPGESMVGKYGIVNNSHLAGDSDPEHPDESEKTRFPEGCLKLGGTGSTLNAFMAYIEGPTSAPVKAAYLDDDDNADGLLEALRGEEVSGTESVYDLQGRKLPKAQRGLNIIRGADGSVKKVMNK